MASWSSVKKLENDYLAPSLRGGSNTPTLAIVRR